MTAAKGPREFLVSLLAMATVLAGAEVFYRDSPVAARLRRGANHITAKRIEYESLGGDIVVTGDSRVFHGINPAVMQETLQGLKGQTYTTFNFGVPSGTTPMFLMIADDAARHRPPPRVFVLGVTPALFSCCDAVGAAGTQPGMRWSAVPRFVRASWFTNVEDAGAAVFYGASQLLGMRTELTAAVRDLTVPPPMSFQIRGYNSLGGRVPPAVQDARSRGRAIAYAELMDKSKGCELRPNPGRYLAEAIGVLKSAGVKVAVMGTPQSRQLDWYHDERHTYFEYLEEVRRITRAFEVPFVDMNAPPDVESSDFIDGDHLSAEGAVIFTRDVATAIVAPLLP